jgi:uncharacterized protein YndB with AHSA1/START domain
VSLDPKSMIKRTTMTSEKSTIDSPNTLVSATADAEFVITRVFDAPRELVWKAHSEIEHLKHWWGPKGFTLDAAKFEFRPGGIFHYQMRAPNGFIMWGRFNYREIAPPERIVYVVSFSDEKGGVTRNPMSHTWPLEMLNTVTFTEHGGRTTLTIRTVALGGTEEERKSFVDGFDSMRQGYTGTLDKLADHLKTQPGANL